MASPVLTRKSRTGLDANYGNAGIKDGSPAALGTLGADCESTPTKALNKGYLVKIRSTHFLMRTALPAVCVLATMTFLAHRADANPIVNGDFETGDLTGWTCSGGSCPGTPADPYWMAVGSGFANSGTYALGIGASNYDKSNNPIYGTISQNLATTIGQTYVVTFAYGEYNNNQTLSGDVRPGSHRTFWHPSMGKTSGVRVFTRRADLALRLPRPAQRWNSTGLTSRRMSHWIVLT
jgi:hypothetical protein